MKQTRLTHDSPHSHTLSTLQASKKYPNVRTVELFIKNIDDHIANSYSRLKHTRQKQLTRNHSTRKADPPSEEGGARLQRINKIDLKSNPLTGGGSSQYETPVVKERRRGQERAGEEEIVLMDNREVMEYINYVYETYNLQDPLDRGRELAQSQLHFETSRKDPKRTDYERYVGSASTLKHSKSPELELTPFSASGSNHPDRPKKKIQIITLRSATSAKQPTIPLKSKQKQLQKSNESRGEALFHSKHISSVSHFSLVPQTYRYCFMCEEPILECNLLAHEAQCQPLQSAYRCDLPGIVQLLDAKIQRLGQEVEQTLLSRGERQIGEEFARIKGAVRSWMQQLPPERLTQTQRGQRQTGSGGQAGSGGAWREEFGRVEAQIGESVCRSFSALGKLNWFAKLRENIAGRYFA